MSTGPVTKGWLCVIRLWFSPETSRSTWKLNYVFHHARGLSSKYDSAVEVASDVDTNQHEQEFALKTIHTNTHPLVTSP